MRTNSTIIPKKKKLAFNLVGKKFSMLTVISEQERLGRGVVTWLCRCDCGNEKVVRGGNLKTGSIKSCGCLLSSKNLKHGANTRSGRTPEYVAWKSMKTRCYTPSFIGYEYYGGRGVKVCDRWLNSFENFLADMGPRPSNKHSLDRYPNVNGDYGPDNCRWAERKEQNSNTRRNKFLTHKDRTETMAEWARLIGIRQAHLCKHINGGKTLSEVIEFFRRKGKLKNDL